MKTMARSTRIVLLVVLSFVGGVFLSHFVSDIALDHNVIAWLWRAVHLMRDRFFPSVREPDELEGMYLMCLLLMCWVATFFVLLALYMFVRRRKRV